MGLFFDPVGWKYPEVSSLKEPVFSCTWSSNKNWWPESSKNYSLSLSIYICNMYICIYIYTYAPLKINMEPKKSPKALKNIESSEPSSFFHHDGLASRAVDFFFRVHTWRIIPVSKWLVTPIYKPFRPFGRGPTPVRGLIVSPTFPPCWSSAPDRCNEAWTPTSAFAELANSSTRLGAAEKFLLSGMP